MNPVPVLDSHVHFWDPRRLRYPWLREITPLDRPFTPRTFPGGRHRPAEAIVVEAGSAAPDASAEVEWIRREARERPWIRGIVAHTELEHPTRAGEAISGYAQDPFVVGVRRNVQDEAPGFLEDAGFRAGVRSLGEAGLPFDACVRAHQLTELAELAAACPQTTVILDHLGKPSPGGPDYRQWRRAMRRLARHGNVSCKLSGLATEASPGTERTVMVAALRDAIEIFSPDRCLYGGDWPVLTLATTYEAWMELVHTALTTYPSKAAEAVLHHNAARLYQLDGSTGEQRVRKDPA